ncbi:SDR family NAD(P)-dependent oxidoreductase [Streptomyces rhizosphaericus]|uniref:SDR family NAD(P)-dependent oxidoreductase n=1 Tax=Streptomyces rhizosphaericus TaxID=114699 RepID=UPI000A3AE1AF|nr:SDR family oxidoreductase [Streptomyces rhizosphaericus]
MKSVLVYGGDRGIGLEVADRFTDIGHQVAISTDLSAPEPYPRSSGNLESERVDKFFHEIETRFGPVEILIVSTEFSYEIQCMNIDSNDAIKAIDASITRMLRVIDRAAISMEDAGQGRVVIIHPGMPESNGKGRRSVYEEVFVDTHRSLVRQLAPDITVNVVIPGVASSAPTALEAPDPQLATKIPMQRRVQPADVAAAVTFFACDAAGYITGNVIRVDGGAAMGV